MKCLIVLVPRKIALLPTNREVDVKANVKVDTCDFDGADLVDKEHCHPDEVVDVRANAKGDTSDVDDADLVGKGH